MTTFYFFCYFRWCCKQHSCPTSAGGLPSGRPHQENQSGTPGKYVQAKEGNSQWTTQKDICQPLAQEKEILAGLVMQFCKLLRAHFTHVIVNAIIKASSEFHRSFRGHTRSFHGNLPFTFFFEKKVKLI